MAAPHPARLPQPRASFTPISSAAFIQAEIVSFDQLIEAGSMAEAKPEGWVRIEGKGYVMQDGDVVGLRFDV